MINAICQTHWVTTSSVSENSAGYSYAVHCHIRSLCFATCSVQSSVVVAHESRFVNVRFIPSQCA